MHGAAQVRSSSSWGVLTPLTTLCVCECVCGDGEAAGVVDEVQQEELWCPEQVGSMLSYSCVILLLMRYCSCCFCCCLVMIWSWPGLGCSSLAAVRKRGREGGRGIEGGRVGSWRTGRGAINGGAAAGGGKLWRRKQHDVRKKESLR